MRQLTRASLDKAARRLARSDADLGGVLSGIDRLPMWGRQPGFAALVRIILEQQVSLVAARTLYLRLARQLGGVTPDTILATGRAGLREFGLTRQKSAYCIGLAERISDGELDLSAVARGPDDAGRKSLLAVPGLGPWSVDVYYLMALRRPDIWPQGDLALAVALKDVKRLRKLPSNDRQQSLARGWAPWRSVAARIIWAHYLARRERDRAAARPC